MLLSENHTFLTSSVDMIAMSKPLLKYDINWFTYRKCYNDGSRVLLTTTPAHLKGFLENKFYRMGNLDAQPDLYMNQVVLFSTFPNQRLVQWARKNFDICHGISLIRKSEEYTEFFSFASSAENSHTLNFCVNNLDFLQRFCDSFISQAGSLLKIAESEKIIIPYHENAFRKYDRVAISGIENNAEIKVSPRQSQCINLILQGNSVKEISTKLNLSQRTIEAYINTIKSKFNVRSKAELIIKLLKAYH